MVQPHETNLALFLDFDNIALGLRDARLRFDTQLLLQRLLEKGKIVVKRAYADWQHFKEYMEPLHQAGIELIEIPARRMTGKNSADIRLVVDAMDLCYSKEHIDSFVIVSGDSDFSPLVSKLRENAKQVIGVGVKNSTSKLLVSNCDEFIFYDDLVQVPPSRLNQTAGDLPSDKRKLFDFLVVTTQRLLQESRGVLYSSLIKDTMKRKRPDFNESKYGYSTFGDLLEDAKNHGLLDVVRDERAGGTWVVRALGKGGSSQAAAAAKAEKAAEENGRKRRRRPRRRKDGEAREGVAAAPAPSAAGQESPAEPAEPLAPGEPAEAAEAAAETAEGAERRDGRRRRGRRSRSRRDREAAAAGEAAAPAAETAAAEAPAEAKKEPGEPAAGKKAAKKAARKTTKKTTKKAAKKTTKKTAKKTTKKTAKKTAKKAAKKEGGQSADGAGPAGGETWSAGPGD